MEGEGEELEHTLEVETVEQHRKRDWGTGTCRGGAMDGSKYTYIPADPRQQVEGNSGSLARCCCQLSLIAAHRMLHQLQATVRHTNKGSPNWRDACSNLP